MTEEILQDSRPDHRGTSPLPPNVTEPDHRNREMTDRQAILKLTAGASHFLVKFEVDECLCVVTRKVVVDPDLLNVGDGCQVKWNGSELLTATVIDKGDKASMEKAEEEHLASMYEKEEATTELPPPPKKTKRSQCRAKENKTRTPHRKLITTRKPLAQIQKGKKQQQFTFELGSPAKMTSPVAKSTPATDDVPPQTNPDDSHLPSLSFSSSNSDDAVYPHPSPHKIVIDVDGYDDKNHSTTKQFKLSELLSSISSTVDIMNSKLTLVTDSLKNLSERQDRVEASLGQLVSLLKPVNSSTAQPAHPPARQTVIPPPEIQSADPSPPASHPADPFPPSHPTANLPLVGQAQVQLGHAMSQLSAPSQTNISPPENPSVDPCLLAQPTPTLPDMGQDKLQQPLLSHSMSKSPAPLSTSAYAHPSSTWYANLSTSLIEHPATTNLEREYIEHSKILDMKSSGISRRNFAKKLVAMIFTETERSTCNVNGRNKPKLDPIRIDYVKRKTFQMYPLNHQIEKIEKAWSECVIAIDEGNRRLNRKTKA